MSDTLKNLIRDNANGGTFCVFPFIQYHENTEQKFKLCCHSFTNLKEHDFNSNELKTIRKQMLKGEKIPHCTSCYNLEKNNQTSPRQYENKHWLKREPRHVKDTVENFENQDIQPIFYDLRSSNICNLACKTCGPYDSSLWAAELKTPNKILKNQTKTINPDSKRLYFAGGEPFLIPQFLEQLKQVSSDCEIVINTNCTVHNQNWIDELKKFKNVCITTSLDSYGSLNDYVRYPSKWKTIEDNIKRFQDYGFYMFVNTVISAYTIMDYPKLLNFLNDIGYTQIHASIIRTPKELTINRLVDHFDLTRYINEIVSHDLVINNPAVLYRIQNLDLTPDSFEPFALETLNQDQRRKISFKDSNFEFYKIYQKVLEYDK